MFLCDSGFITRRKKNRRITAWGCVVRIVLRVGRTDSGHVLSISQKLANDCRQAWLYDGWRPWAEERKIWLTQRKEEEQKSGED